MTPNRRLKQARELRGWSQAKVAEQIGTDATTVSRWERGLFSPTPYFRERLCTLFSKNAEELGLLDSGDRPSEGEQQALTSRPSAALAVQQEIQDQTSVGLQVSTIAPPAAPSWPRRGDTFAYILDSAAHDQQAHILWEDAYVRAMRGQRVEAQQLGEASLYAFEHVGHPNAEAIREWLKKNELVPPPPSAPPATTTTNANVPSTPLPLPDPPKRDIKRFFHRRNIGLAIILLTIAALGLASFIFNQSMLPPVQARIQTSPTAQEQIPTQGAHQPGAKAAVSGGPADTPTSVPISNPTMTTPAQSPTADPANLNISISPSSLSPANCNVDSGYRCTLTVVLYSQVHTALNWTARSNKPAVIFNPSSGSNMPGHYFQVIVYIQTAPGQACELTFTVTYSSSSVSASVPWQG